MSSWIETALNVDSLQDSMTEASRRLLNKAIGEAEWTENHNLRFMANSLELAVIDLLQDETKLNEMRATSTRAFQLLRVIPRPAEPFEAAKICLRTACLGILGERSVDVSRILKESPWPTLPLDASSWGDRTLATVLDVWLRLVRKDGWDDLDHVQQRIIALREQQKNFESDYLGDKDSAAQTAAWELVALYHLAKAAELLSLYTTQGEVGGRFDIHQQLEAQFDRAITACTRAEITELHNITILLSKAATQLANNSIWTVTRAVNSRVTQFVRHLVARGRPRPIFEVLPPQRRALREQGLLGSSHRAIVVNLPTSSGKTLIAEFRVLQALNQFENEKGWVAYLAPTRALVNQICSRLRRDFLPLNISVERVSPALEIDGLETMLLTDSSEQTMFRVLVTTPEKLDLLLRGGWEEKIRRPLTLVVVDEAHNLAQKERGIKLELLLATINRECRYAQFLLLTPFINNAQDIARWLAPDSFMNVELSLDWQPNDRAVVLTTPKQTTERGQFSIELETIHTTRNTLTVPETIPLSTGRTLGLSWSNVKNSASKLAAATAQIIRERGPVIVLSARPDWAWSLADNFKHGTTPNQPSEEIKLVQRYLSREFGQDFELSGLLEYGVGIHHSGLSDEARILMEWLLENEHIDVLVATTTIAQGVNFPVSTVVIAQNQYFDPDEGMSPMPPEDFWNVAGRSGRVEQGTVGIIALAAPNEEKAAELRAFVGENILALNSTLIAMVQEAMQGWGQLDLHTLYYKPEWSTFLQYLAHTYRQIGDPNRFASEIEQILRGTLGFQNLRRINTDWANRLIVGVLDYSERLSGKPLSLVDNTGFSWESVSATLARLSDERINRRVWDPDLLFRSGNRNLQKLMGILLSVPELRENLKVATGGRGPDGNLLARIVSSWVNGASLPDLTREYFSKDTAGNDIEFTKALTNCCRNIFGKLIQTTSWGLAALQSLNIGNAFEEMSENERQILRNLPARVFYGVNSDEAVALRLLGVPRGAAQPLARQLGDVVKFTPPSQLRAQLAQTGASPWVEAMRDAGDDYFKVWRILEGLE